ncbi:MAG: hypothetical protein KDA77_18725, partial [Planctomycetaceae bacterium]|nr:hypothetical protein [Planctomycetaceae bacterium]
AEFHHEPSLALYAGPDGLDVVHRVIEQAANYLTEHGILILEVGQAAEALERAYPHHMFLWTEFEWGGEGVCVLDYQDCYALAHGYT